MRYFVNGGVEPARWSEAAAAKGVAPAPTRDYRIAAVNRALDVIEALARIGPAPLSRLAEEAGCTRTAAFRLLRTLQARDFAVQEASGVWRLGVSWAVVSRAALAPGALAAAAAPHLERLSVSVGETVLLRVRRDLVSVTIATHHAPDGLQTAHEPEDDGPLHAGSGRLLLAYAPDSVREGALARRLPRFTSSTRADPAWIAADLPRLRARGWMIAEDETAEGSTLLAAPVLDAKGEAAAVLVIAAASFRMRAKRPRMLIPALLGAAAALARALGAP